MKYILIVVLFATIGCGPTGEKNLNTESVKRFDRPDASILKGVSIPADKKLFISSGQVTAAIHLDAPDKSLARYGNTYEQSVGTLEKLKGVLSEAGLSLSDVVYLGVYIAPDPRGDGNIDFDAWFKAYGAFFNNDTNPVKTARTTLGVAALARPYLLVEVEAIAVY